MKLLILTQEVNKNDTVLGFFHAWIEKLSEQFESIEVICLERDEYGLPKNVAVHSLGKEEGSGRLTRVWRFYTYVWTLRKNYDAVFVHMNQEYILLGGMPWKLLGKKIYMWRNHHAGTILTDIAAIFCTKIFCTSRYSFTAKYAKTTLMPVGVDTDVFKPDKHIDRKRDSVLFLGRMSPVKKPDMLLGALISLHDHGVDFSATFVGDPGPDDDAYYISLKEMAKSAGIFNTNVAFLPGVPHDETVKYYNSHEIFVNLSTSGMYDKTIFEAMVCECLVLVSNENMRNIVDDKFIFNYGDKKMLCAKLERLIKLADNEKKDAGAKLREVAAKNHSLSLLVQKLCKEIVNTI